MRQCEKLIQNEFTTYFLMKIIELTIQTRWSIHKWPNNKYHGENTTFEIPSIWEIIK